MKYLLFLLICLNALCMKAQKISSVKMDELLKVIDTTSGPVVVNFWATWCKPCTEEIPVFEKNIGRVKLILVSLDFRSNYPEKIKTFIAKHKYKSAVFWLNETDADSFCPKIDKTWEGNIPATLFVNRSKNYRHFVNVQLSEEQFKKQLERMK